MTATYLSCPCPRCGYPETQDFGPYEPDPSDAIIGPVDPEIHYLECGRCGCGFDAGTEAAAGHRQAWTREQHELGIHHTCDPAACARAAMGIWTESP